MTHAFDNTLANFKSMGSASDNIYIQKILQRTYLDFNAEGVKASSITFIGEGAMAPRPEDDIVHITFNQPFMYMIVDKNTHTPIFIGTINNL